MSDVYSKAVGLLGVFLFLILVVPPLSGAVFGLFVDGSVERYAETTKDVVVTTSEIVCSQQYVISDIENKIKSIPFEVVESYNTNSEKDENVQRLLTNYQMGLELTEMEFLTIAEDVDKHHKMKYGFDDLQKLCQIQQFLK